MKISTIQKWGGISLILGSVFFTAYSVLFPLLLPVAEFLHDATVVINNPVWIKLALTAMAGVILMIFGFMAVYSRISAKAGIIGFLGFIFIELAYISQACKVTWEICLYPLIANHAAAAVLFKESILQHYPLVVAFKTTASILILLGIIFFSLTIILSKEFSKTAGIFIFTGAFLYAAVPVVLVHMAGIFILSIGCIILGSQLIRKQQA